MSKTIDFKLIEQMVSEMLPKASKVKACACGKQYRWVPEEATLWDMGKHKVWLWQCECRSHLVSPFDVETAAYLKQRYLVKASSIDMEGASDLVKARKEKALIDDHEAHVTEYRFGDDEGGGS